MESFVLIFIPIFIVLDAPGNLPIVYSLTCDMNRGERIRVINIAMITAFFIGLVFLFFGNFILRVLDISLGNFAIAGGIILLVLAIKYMTTGHFTNYSKDEMVAVVPIGTPLVVGPATITTLMLLSQQYKIYWVLLSFSLNIALCWGIFLIGQPLVRIFGLGGMRVISKVFSLLLAAIAISMIFHGLVLVGVVNP